MKNSNSKLILLGIIFAFLFYYDLSGCVIKDQLGNDPGTIIGNMFDFDQSYYVDDCTPPGQGWTLTTTYSWTVENGTATSLSVNPVVVKWKKMCGTGKLTIIRTCTYTKPGENNVVSVCTASVDVQLFEPNLPSVSFNPTSYSVPCNTTQTIDINPYIFPQEPDLKYEWTIPDGIENKSSSTTGSSLKIRVPCGTQAKEIKLKYYYQGCSTKPELTLQINRTPAIPENIGTNLQIPCNHYIQNMQFCSSIPSSECLSYSWETNGLSCSGSTTPCISCTIPLSTQGFIHTIKLTTSAGPGCETDHTITITRTGPTTDKEPTRPCFCYNVPSIVTIDEVEGAVTYEIAIGNAAAAGWTIEPLPNRQWRITASPGAIPIELDMIIGTNCGNITKKVYLKAGPPTTQPIIEVDCLSPRNPCCDKDVKEINIYDPNIYCDGTYIEYEFTGNFTTGGTLQQWHTETGTLNNLEFNQFIMAGHGTIKARLCNPCGCGPWAQVYIERNYDEEICWCDYEPDCGIMWKMSFNDEDDKIAIDRELTSNYKFEKHDEYIIVNPLKKNEKYNLKLIDLKGRVLFTQIDLLNNYNCSISNLNSGTYLLAIITSKSVTKYQFVVIR